MKKIVTKLMITKKVGMTQLITESARIIPVTVLQPVPTIIMTRTESESGCHRIMLGYDSVKLKRANKPHQGQFASRDLDVYKHIAEFILQHDDASMLSPGSSLSLDQFNDLESIFIKSTSKGCGFSGTIKRWNFSRGPESHGSKSHRIPGSIGAGTTPSRVVKGKKMAGQYGNTTVTLRSQIQRLDLEKQLIFVRGGVPGPSGGQVIIGASV